MRRIAVKDAEGYIRDLIPFRTRTKIGEGLWAKEGDPGEEFGVLPAQHHADLKGARYTVFSYQTPIAFVSASGEKTLIGEKFSITTTEHQYAVCSAWGIPHSVMWDFTRAETLKDRGKTPFTSREGW